MNKCRCLFNIVKLPGAVCLAFQIGFKSENIVFVLEIRKAAHDSFATVVNSIIIRSPPLFLLPLPPSPLTLRKANKTFDKKSKSKCIIDTNPRLGFISPTILFVGGIRGLGLGQVLC